MSCIDCAAFIGPQLYQRMRELKHHEKKLLKKVDFFSWKDDQTIREAQIVRKYLLQEREDYMTENAEFKDSADGILFQSNIFRYRKLTFANHLIILCTH